jgi:flagellar M-ring protein FliF
VAGAEGGVAALEGPGAGSPDLRLEHARKLAKENPLAMASVVRGWMNN